MDNQSSRRLLAVFVQLLNGNKISFDHWQVLNPADKPKSERVFQRDMTVIRDTLRDFDTGYRITLSPQGYQLDGQKNPAGFSYALALAHILLASRAFPRTQTRDLIDFIADTLSLAQQQVFARAIKRDLQSYSPLSRPKSLLSLLARMTTGIDQHQRMTFHYQPLVPNGHAPQYQGQPLAVYFENYYFYVIIQLVNHDEIVHDKPTVFRLDRMASIDWVEAGDAKPGFDKFSLQQQRQNVYLLPIGDTLTFTFSSRVAEQNILDRFPTARVTGHTDNGDSLIEATAQEEGALLWLQSQGPNVKLLSPAALVNKLKHRLQTNLAQYD